MPINIYTKSIFLLFSIFIRSRSSKDSHIAITLTIKWYWFNKLRAVNQLRRLPLKGALRISSTTKRIQTEKIKYFLERKMFPSSSNYNSLKIAINRYIDWKRRLRNGMWIPPRKLLPRLTFLWVANVDVADEADAGVDAHGEGAEEHGAEPIVIAAWNVKSYWR